MILGVASEAPYPPSGWRPQGTPFILPQDFIPSALVRPAQTVYPVTADREGGRRENLDFFGQTNVVSRTSSNQYIPPNQYIPSPDPRQNPTPRPNFFVGIESTPKTNSFPRRNGDPNFFPRSEDDLLKVQGLPSSDPNNFIDGLQVNVGNAGDKSPGKAYGVPEETSYIASDQNAYISSENLEEENGNQQPEIVSKGQYYILTEDNNLQKVSFETKQSDKDVQDNTFTAELKYQPVEAIADPVYAYNKKGQLVRILRKK